MEDFVKRHIFNAERLDKLYNDLCDYAADCTQEEFAELNAAFTAIKISIHQRLRNETDSRHNKQD